MGAENKYVSMRITNTPPINENIVHAAIAPGWIYRLSDFVGVYEG